MENYLYQENDGDEIFNQDSIEDKREKFIKKIIKRPDVLSGFEEEKLEIIIQYLSDLIRKRIIEIPERKIVEVPENKVIEVPENETIEVEQIDILEVEIPEIEEVPDVSGRKKILIEEIENQLLTLEMIDAREFDDFTGAEFVEHDEREY